MSSNLKMNGKRFFTPHFFLLAANPTTPINLVRFLNNSKYFAVQASSVD